MNLQDEIEKLLIEFDQGGIEKLVKGYNQAKQEIRDRINNEPK